MIKFKTSRFGELEVKEDKVISFPSGLIGIPELRKYVLIDHKDTPLKWMQSIDDPEMAFIVAHPSIIVEEYSLDLDSRVKQYLNLDKEDDLAVLVTIRVDGEDVIANFQGPILVNSQSMTGVQIVIDRPAKEYQKVV
jgi:flagellar assembly factor FliW